MKTLTEHPSRLALNAASRTYPDAWRRADDFRGVRGKGKAPDWPAWCFLPLSGWYAIVCTHENKSQLDELETSACAHLAALGAWRYTQGIYRFHPELFSRLAATEPGDLPVDTLLRLPEWCVYVDVEGLWDESVDGFFAFLEFNLRTGQHELRIVGLRKEKRSMVTAHPIHLGPWPLTEALDRAFQEAKKHGQKHSPAKTYVTEIAPLMQPFLSLLLYLCAGEPDIAGQTPDLYPQHPSPKKVKGGSRLFPPDKPRIWRIGEVTALD